MRKIINISVVLLLMSLKGFSQTILIDEVTVLPDEILEASGLEIGDEPNTFWSHNDKNNPTEIYQFDTAGVLLKTIKISNGLTPQQSDYEDLARDDNNNIYIADVGDNKLDKNVYRIYKINTDSIELTEVPTIKFYYPNFESKNCESIFWWDDFIYFFIKNPLNSSGLITQSYRVPDQPGEYEAEFLENFNNPGSYPFPITAADISPNGETLILMSKDEFYILRCFTPPYFFSASAVLKVPFERAYVSNRIPQTEGVVFVDDDTIFIVDEQTDPDDGPPLEFGNLYTYTLTDIFTNNTLDCTNRFFDCGLIENYTFSNDVDQWEIVNANNISSNWLIEDQKLNVSFFYGGTERDNIRVQQKELKFEKDNVYVLQFEAKASVDRPIDIVITDSLSTILFIDSVLLSTNSQLFSRSFFVDENLENANLYFNLGGPFTLSSVTLDNICVKPIQCQKFEEVDNLIKLNSFRTEDYINADYPLIGGQLVTYTAADSICLFQNFEVSAGKEFNALISECE